MQKFNFHTHTYRCGHADKTYLDEDYILDYIKMGFTKMAFTDHCPQQNMIDKRKGMRMDYSQKREYLDAIKFLKEKHKDRIEIEAGFEIEYLPELKDELFELKNESDKIILGQHFVNGEDGQLKIHGMHSFTDAELKNYANLIVEAASIGLPDIIAHPDMYMMGRKEFGETESKVAHIICAAAEKYNIPLEINVSSTFYHTYFVGRKLNEEPLENQILKLSKVPYPNKKFWEIASEYDVRVIYGLDVHQKGQIEKSKETIELAEMIIGKEVLNKLNFVNDV